MDGTIYRGGTLFDFTRPFLAKLDSLGVGYTFLTNNSSKSVRDYLKHLERMGIQAGPERLYTSTLSTIDYLREAYPEVRKLYLVGTPSLRGEFVEAGFTVVEGDEEPQAVVVGFDTDLSYPRLCKAAWWISRDKPFIATHPDRICPTDQPTVLVDCGSVCACLQAATGKAPTAVLGKPDPRMLTGILHRHGLQPDQLAMVGDRTYTDIAMARRAGALGVLVLTGETTAAEAQAFATADDLVVPSLREFGELLG
jgi:NagD protein